MTQNAPIAYRIRGNSVIRGEMQLQGSKNSLLPLLAASILRPGRIMVNGVPDITDKDAVCDILTSIGCRCENSLHTLTVDSSDAFEVPISPELMKKTRGAFVFLGAMIARFHSFSFAMPGGCMLGKRPIDFHLDALTKMGVHFTKQSARCMKAECTELKGTLIDLPFPSVGATQNILLAACGAEGETVLNGAAIEPEVMELADFLNTRGFYVCLSGERQFTVIGSPALCHSPLDTIWQLSGDRIAAVTYLCAAALTGGELILHGIERKQIADAADLLEKAGCQITDLPQTVYLTAPRRLKGIGHITTAPHPGFATDMQPLFMAMLVYADGKSSFTETVFENRFSHCAQLTQMGAKITIRQKTAEITGVPHLYGRDLLAADLRGGAALTIAALGADCDSTLYGAEYIARGYEDLFANLNSLGARITPVK